MNGTDFRQRRALLAAIATVPIPTFAATGTSAALLHREVAPDIARILRRQRLIVAVPAFDSPPFFESGPQGSTGSDVELARGLASALSVALELRVGARSFNELVEVVARREDPEVDLAIGKISRTVARSRFVGFSDSYHTSRHSLLIHRVGFAKLSGGRNAPDVIRSYSGSVGVIAGSSFADAAAKRFPGATVVPFKSWTDTLGAITAGEVVAAYRDEGEMKRLFEQQPDLALKLRSIAFTDLLDTVGMVLPWDSRQLLAAANLYLTENRLQAPARPGST